MVTAMRALPEATAAQLARLALICLLFAGNAAFAVTANNYGIVSGDPSRAQSNTAALRQLVSPSAYGGTSSYVGDVTFPDGTTYYFNDVIPIRDGIHIDMMGSTLHFHKTATSCKQNTTDCDDGSGFIFAIRTFSIANGTIEVDYDGTGVSHAGNALMLGQRWANGGIYFQPSFDSQLSSPMGNITVSNVQIRSNNPNGECGLSMTGGLQAVLINNVTIDGQGRLVCGIYYEFGNATQPLDPASTPTPPPPYTSHAHGMTFSGISVSNLNPATGLNTVGLGIGGAYDTLVDGLTVTGLVDYAFLGTAGEAAFYKMWPAQVPAAQRTVTLTNVTAAQVRIAGLALGGAGKFSDPNDPNCAPHRNHACGYLGTYLDPSSYTAADETDLLSYVVDGFNLKGTAGSTGSGIFGNPRSVTIRNGTVSGFWNGLFLTDDCTMVHINNTKVLDSLAEGLNMTVVAIWNPPRPKTGYITNSFIAGSGVSNKGAYAIALDAVNSFLIEGNTFGYASESSQGGALRLGTSASNVVAHENNVVSTYSSDPAYVSLGNASNGDTLQGNTGVTSSQGSWVNVADSRPVLVKDLVGVSVSAGASVTLSATFSGTITSYVWLKNGAVVVGATTNSLTIAHASVNDYGTYQVLAKNVAATTASLAIKVTNPATSVISSYIRN
jgi:hypothetical protein